MFFRSICSIVIFATLMKICEDVEASHLPEKLSIYQINGKKSLQVVSNKFLSFTVDPEVLMHVSDCQVTNSSTDIVRSLTPAYLRIAGPHTNRLIFVGSTIDNKTISNFSVDSNYLNEKTSNVLVTGTQWIKFNEFISNIGLDLIIALNGAIFDENTNLDFSNSLEFITFSNKHNLSSDWQIGYEVQRSAYDDGKKTGHAVVRLRKILEVFPRYQNSLILGPDLTNFESRDDISFIKNYLMEVQNSLNVFTVHPYFWNMDENADIYDTLADILLKMDSNLWLKEGLLKTLSKGVSPKKPIWIAESEIKNSMCEFSDSLLMVKRLGVAAKLGVSVYLRKPHLLSLYEPTSEYWISVLYKALVGQIVLDIKLTNGNATKVNTFSHCTQIHENFQESIINPNVVYERGSVTVYGANTASEPSRISFKMNTKSEGTIHLYVLTEESQNGISKTLLNKQKLGLSNNNELPVLSPKILESAKYITIPARSIFFLVFANAKCPVCALQNKEEKQDVTDEEDNDSETSSIADNVSEIIEDGIDDNVTYVSYLKRNEYPNRMLQEGSASNHENERSGKEGLESKIENKNYDDKLNSYPQVKYITFSDDTWLSSFPEKLKEILNKKQQHLLNEGFENAMTKKTSKLTKYRLMARAMLGKRNFTNNANLDGDLQTYDATNFDKFDKPVRFSRSVPLLLYSPNISIEKNLFQSPNEKVRTVQHETESNEIFFDESSLNNLPKEEMIFTQPEREQCETRKRRDAGDKNELTTFHSKKQSIKMVENQKQNHVHDKSLVNSDKENITSTTTEERHSTLMKSAEERNIPLIVAEINDEILNNVKTNREINDEMKDINEHFVNDDPFDSVEGQRSLNSLRPVSPFPRKSKITKTKLKTMRPRVNSEIIGSTQSDESPKIESPVQLTATSFSDANENISTTHGAIFTRSEDEKTKTSSKIENIEAKTLNSDSTTTSLQSLLSTTNVNEENKSNLIQTEEENMHFNENVTSNLVSSNTTNIVLPSNIKRKDETVPHFVSKIKSPEIWREHNTRQPNSLLQLHTAADTAQVLSSLDVHNRAKNSKIETNQNGKHFTINPSLVPKSDKTNTVQLLDSHNTKIKEIIDQHMTKITELKKKIHEKVTKSDVTHFFSSLRNKRGVNNEFKDEITDTSAVTSTLKSKNQVSNQTEDNSSRNVVALSKKASTKLFRLTTSKPTTARFAKLTTKRIIPRKGTPATHGHAVLSSSTELNDNRRSEKQRRMKKKSHDRVERDIAKNVFKTEGNHYGSVTNKIKNNLRSVSKWTEKKFSNTKLQEIYKKVSEKVKKSEKSHNELELRSKTNFAQ